MNSINSAHLALNSASHMKRTPQLEFHYDGTLDNALHIDELLRREEQELGAQAHEIPVPGAVARAEPGDATHCGGEGQA